MKYKYTIFAALISITLFPSCASYIAAMTPSARITTDDFDGSQIVYQSPVSAASSLTEAWYTLGFDYVSRTPNVVYVTGGTRGVQNIFGLEFNVGGRFIKAKTASLTTEFNLLKYGNNRSYNRSNRRFAVSYSDFVAIATAPSVKMKVAGANDYDVSSFGTSTKALVNLKFPDFLEKVRSLKGS